MKWFLKIKIQNKINKSFVDFDFNIKLRPLIMYGKGF